MSERANGGFIHRIKSIVDRARGAAGQPPPRQAPAPAAAWGPPSGRTSADDGARRSTHSAQTRHEAETRGAREELERSRRELAELIGQRMTELIDRAEEIERVRGRALVGDLMDLHDELMRGLASCRECTEGCDILPPRGRWWRRSAAKAAGQQRTAVAALAESIERTADQLLDIMRDLDITPVVQVGTAFDPHRMVAVGRRDGAGHPDGTVVQVLATGFMRCGELLRPARVIVTGTLLGEPTLAAASDEPRPAGVLVEPKTDAANRLEPVERAT